MRLLELVDRPRQLALLAEHVAEQDVRRRHGRAVERLAERLLGLLPAREMRVERAEREVRQERLGLALDARLAQRELRRRRVARLGGRDAAVDQRLEVVGLDGQDLLEVARTPARGRRAEKNVSAR